MQKNIKKIVKLLVPIKFWNTKRTARIIECHQKVADFWNPIIEDYLEGKIEKYSLKAKRQFGDQKIIWQYWGQGINMDDLPEIIQICFQSVERYKGNYQIIRLTDETISDYIDLPDFVWNKRNNPQFTRTIFSDLLRLALLTAYGGIWLDATILLTGSLPDIYAKSEFFMFQRSDEEENKGYWENVYAYYFGWRPDFRVRVLNSIIFSRKDSIVISTLFDLLLYFWKTQNTVPDYFFFQILFNELMNKHFLKQNCPIVNDCIPHLLQTKINGKYDSISFVKVLRQTTIHKMAYFDEKAMARLKILLKS